MSERAAKLVKHIQHGIVTLDEVLARTDLTDAEREDIRRAIEE